MNHPDTDGQRISSGGKAPARALAQSAGAAARRARIEILLKAIGALLVLVTVGGLTFALWRERESALEEAAASVGYLAQLAEEQTANHLTAVDLTLHSVAQDIGAARAGKIRGRDIGEILRERRQQVPFVRTLFILDSAGRLAHTSNEFFSGPDRSDREYFLAHRESPSQALHVSKPYVSRRRGTWTLSLSQALLGPDGRFEGVAVASIDMAYLERVYGSVPVKPTGSTVLVRRDGVVLARTPRIESMLGKMLPGGGRIVSTYLPKADVGAYRAASSIDGVERLVAYRLVPGRNVVAVATRGVDEALSEWRTQAWVEAGYGGAFLALALLLVWLALREVRRREALDVSVNEHEAQHASLVESALDAIVSVDENQRIVVFNAAAERLFRRSAADMLGEPLDLLLPQRYRAGHGRLIRAFEASGVVSRPLSDQRAVTGVRADGVEFPAEASISQARIGARKLFTVIMRDVSERRRAEAEIARLNADLERRVAERTGQLEAANRELEAFSYSVSHDLRTPLRHIAGFTRLLLEEPHGLDAARTRYLQLVAKAVDRMDALIDDLLAFSRAGRAELRSENVDLARLAEEAREECMREAGERNVVWNLGKLPRVKGDPALLRLAIVNLFSNAVKFTAGRTEAVIEADAVPGDAGEVIVRVRDNGVGFDMRYAERLFGVFQRLHRDDQFEGTGIGLATVRRIAERHGGRVWAEAKPEQGATFFLALKQAPETVRPE